MVIRLVIALCVALVTKMSFSRELTQSEKLVIYGLDQIEQVKTYMKEKIDTDALSFRDQFTHQAFLRGCVPLRLMMDRLSRAQDEKEDQSKELAVLYRACSQATMNLVKTFIEQNP